MKDITGITLGPYRILERIGRGGMASVYKAYQASMDRTVALKVLPEEFADDPGFRMRFEREAKVVAKLQHINIVPVFDYGQERDISYLVMPYIPSGTLKDHLEGGRLPLDEVARIFSQIADALDYAHRQGIIHRDIKPGNVLFDESGNALLSDFGLTRMAETASSLTGSMVIGTPIYMSPEQGRGQPLDTRSDIYSMGIMLYEMVTGDVPFNADTHIAVIFKHIHDPLPLPRDLRPELPEAAQNVILKALAKDAEQRYAKCGEMARDFSRAIAGMPVAVDLPKEYDPSFNINNTVVPKIDAPSLTLDDNTHLLRSSKPRFPVWMLFIIMLIVIGGGLIALVASQSNAEPPTQVAVLAETATETARPTDEPTQTELPTLTDIPTDFPTLDAFGAAQATNAVEATVNAARTRIFEEGLTQAATLWTNTPTDTLPPTATVTQIPSATLTAVPTHTSAPMPTSVTPAPTMPPTEAAVISETMFRVGGFGAVLRNAPIANSATAVTTVYDSGLPITGISADGSYYQVFYDGQYLWVSKSWGQVEGDASTIPVIGEPAASGATFVVGGFGAVLRVVPVADSAAAVTTVYDIVLSITGISEDGGYYRVAYNGQQLWVSKSWGQVEGDASTILVVGASTIPTQQVLLFQNNFEDGLVDGIASSGLWHIKQDSTGNFVYQGGAESQQSTFYIGSSAWSDYVVEMRFRPLDYSGPSYDDFEVCVRCNALFSSGYTIKIPATGNTYWQRRIQGQDVELAQTHVNIAINEWNSLRIEVSEQAIRTWINGNRISDVNDSSHASGGVYILIEPGLLIDFDDIRVLDVSEIVEPTITPTPLPDSVRFEFDGRAPGTGWSDPETVGATTFIWMNNTTATLRLMVPTDQSLRLQARVLYGMGTDIVRSLRLKVNGQDVMLNRIGDDVPLFYSAVLSQEVLAESEGVVNLIFEISRTQVAGGGDARTLGLAFDWIELSP